MGCSDAPDGYAGWRTDNNLVSFIQSNTEAMLDGEEQGLFQPENMEIDTSSEVV